ncbi:MAG: type II secretion system protein M [Dokdonella sp.]
MIRLWWDGLQTRERLIFGGGLALAVVMLVWGVVWQPLGHERARLGDEVEVQRRELALVRAVAAIPSTAANSPSVKLDRQGKSLLALVDASARDANLESQLKRVEPIGNRSVRASFEFASFDTIVGWLESLAKSYGVHVTDLSVDRVEGNGLVSARITLEDAP